MKKIIAAFAVSCVLVCSIIVPAFAMEWDDSYESVCGHMIDELNSGLYENTACYYSSGCSDHYIVCFECGKIATVDTVLPDFIPPHDDNYCWWCGNNFWDYVNHVAHEVKAGRSIHHICNDLRKQNKWTVSPSTLYRYIDLGYIPGVTNKHLPEKSRRKRSKGKIVAARPPKGTSIERRPKEVDSRSTFGHWELDSVIGKAQGKRQSLLVLTERMTRFEIIIRASAKTSAATVHALDSTLSKFPQGTLRPLPWIMAVSFKIVMVWNMTRMVTPA